MSDSLRAVVKYERDNDLVLQFLENRCEQDEPVNVKAKDLYSAFKIWAKSEGAYVLSARKFNAEMEEIDKALLISLGINHMVSGSEITIAPEPVADITKLETERDTKFLNVYSHGI